MSEKTEQKALVKWFSYQYKPYRIIALLNAQKLLSKAKNPAVMIKGLVAEGFVFGASDLFIAKPVGIYHGMWLEMKDVGKTYSSVSPNQIKFIKDMQDAGYYATWAAGFDIGQAKITDYMNG